MATLGQVKGLSPVVFPFRSEAEQRKEQSCRDGKGIREAVAATAEQIGRLGSEGDKAAA